MKKALIFTSFSEHLAEKIKKKPNNLEVICLGKNKDGKRLFPDGEVYARIKEIKNLKNRSVIIVHSGSPCPNKGLMELETVLQILKDNQIKPKLFFAYFPYGQQDKIFLEGEANIAEGLIKKFINYYGVKKIWGVDLHFEGRNWLKKYPVVNISAAPLLMEKARSDFGKNILFVSPDKGGKRRTGIAGMKKERIDSFNVRIIPEKIFVKNKIVAAVDDIVETGGTLLRFQKAVKKAGAKKIIALATHGILPDGIKRIKEKFDKLYLTNSVKQKWANIDITPLIKKALG